MERMDKNLTTYLRDPVTLSQKYTLLYDVAKGLNHLHSQKPAIIHRDLTAGNVLLTSDGVAKISDFGNSRMVDLSATPELLTSSPGTLDYMPPEAMEGGKYDERLDMFSYGHLAIHVMIQRRPHPLLRPTYFEGGKLIPRTEVERRQRYLSKVETILVGGVQDPFYLIIVKCLQDEPQFRPSCKKVLLSPIFNDCI